MRLPAPIRVSFIACLALIALILHGKTQSLLREVASPYPLASSLSYSVARSAVAAFSRSEIAMDRAELPARLRRGETMTGLLARLGVSPSEANSAARAASAHLDLRRLRAGDRYFVSFDEESALREVTFMISSEGRLGVRRQGSNWLADFRAFEVSTVFVYCGIPTETRTPMMITTTRSSMSVKPRSGFALRSLCRILGTRDKSFCPRIGRRGSYNCRTPLVD